MLGRDAAGTRGMTGSFRIGLALLVAAGLVGCAGDAPLPTGEPSFYRSLAKGGELDPGAAQSMISGYRGNNGLGAVTLDPTLMRLAEEQARAMAAKDKLDHNVGRSFDQRIRTSGFDAGVAVENISAGYHTLAEAFSGWRDSPPHRANMLNRGVTRMGIAAVYSPNSKFKVYWALILAAPDEKRG
jgi:Cysteine-rich secretory protein family